MTVTSPKPTSRSPRQRPGQSRSGRTPESRQRPEESRQRPDEEASEGQKSSSKRVRQIVGGVLAFAALAIYFIWLAKEMGGATPNGEGELAGVFAAILVAVAALAVGALLGGRGEKAVARDQGPDDRPTGAASRQGAVSRQRPQREEARRRTAALEQYGRPDDDIANQR